MFDLHPSKAYRWTQCYAAPSLSHGFPTPESDDDQARLEGIAAAALINEALKNGGYVSCRDYIPMVPNSNMEMANTCQKYVDLVLNRQGQVYTETPLDFYPGVVTPGRLDVAVVRHDKGLLYVDDFKFGHRIVEPTTPQLVIYADALLSELDPTIVFHIQRVQLAIYQPNAIHHKGIYRKRVLTVDELMLEAEGIRERALECHKPEPIATPGAHCHDCPAAAHCEALRHTGFAIGDTIRSRVAKKLTPQELANQLDYVEGTKKMLDALDKSLKTEALARHKKEDIPGWASATGSGRRRFIYDGPTIQMMTGVNPYVEEKTLVTPAELERRGANVDVVQTLTETPKTKRRMVRADSAAEIFGD